VFCKKVSIEIDDAYTKLKYKKDNQYPCKKQRKMLLPAKTSLRKELENKYHNKLTRKE